MHRKIAVLAAAGALAVPAAAQAHVTLQPNSAVVGAYTVLNVRVPNERDKASTVKVDVRFPDGFASVLYQPRPGWKVRVIKKKLATPGQTDDGPITEGVSRIIWTGNRKTANIGPGQFTDFPISVQIPGKAGDVLTFKALQTYSNGEVVRWLGAPGADEPAPQVKVTGTKAQRAGGAAAGTPVAGEGDGAGSGPGTPALVTGGLLLALGAAAVSRRRQRASTAGA
jgi:uncharacterized protein YcnI